MVITRLNLLQTSIFDVFHNFQVFHYPFNENKKVVSYAKAPNIMVLCKYYFAFFVCVKI